MRLKRQPKRQKPKSLATHKDTTPVQVTFLEHVYEVRRRLFLTVLTVIIASAAGFQYKDQLVAAVMAPLHGQKLVYLTPGGGFSFIFTLCLYFGALIAIPVIVYHIYRFLQPLLGKTSRRFVATMIILSSMLAFAGACFGYFVAIPAAINFLMTFAGDAVSPNLTADSYLGFVVAYMLGLAALFQLPLLLFMLDHIRPFPPGTLLSTQRFVIIGAVVAAAVITPTPDVVNQMIVAGPIIIVYQLGAVAVFTRRHAQRRLKKDASFNREVITTENNEIPATVTQELLPKPIVTATAAPVHTIKSALPGRSIDGFTRQVRHSAPIRVPVRPEVNDVPPSRHLPTRPLRSIDGFSIV